MPQVSQWTSSCLENCVKKLAGLNKPFKYVVTCIIMQKNGKLDALRTHPASCHAEWCLQCVHSMFCFFCLLPRCWVTHSSFLLVGQHNRWEQDSTMGEQDHVLHHYRLWLSNLSWVSMATPHTRHQLFGAELPFSRAWHQGSKFTANNALLSRGGSFASNKH